MHDELLSDEDRQAIRELFLRRKKWYRRRELHALLQVSEARLRDILHRGSLAAIEDTHPRRYEWADVADCALHERWTPRLVHDALGEEALLGLPDSHRFESVTVRLPRYQIAALEATARSEGKRRRLPLRPDDVLEHLIALDENMILDRVQADLLRWPLNEEPDPGSR